MEPTITIRPRPAARMVGSKRWVSSMWPMTLIWNRRSRASRGSSSRGPDWLSPALLTSTDGVPRCNTSSAKVVMLAGSSRSNARYSTPGIGSTTLAGLRVVPMTWKFPLLSCARAAAVAAPMPEEAPVTTATPSVGTGSAGLAKGRDSFAIGTIVAHGGVKGGQTANYMARNPCRLVCRRTTQYAVISCSGRGRATRRPPTEQTLPRTLSGTRTAAARHLWKELCALVCAVVAEGERQRGHAEALRLLRQSGEDKRPCNHHALFLNFRRWRVTTGESIYGTRCTFCPPSHRPQRLRYR